MGMTIEEHIAQLKKLKSFHNGSYGVSINFAIETMRKYQKIQEIYLKWNRNYDVQTSDAWTEIIGVIKDGNDD